MNKKTLLFTAFHSLISKNILNTDAFTIIKNRHDLNIVLLVPINKIAFFEENFGSENIKVCGVDYVSLVTNKKSKIFSYISHLLLDTHYLWYKKVERRGDVFNLKKYIKYYIEIAFTKVFSRIMPAKQLFRYIFVKSSGLAAIASIFDQYKPDFFFSTDLFDETDVLFNAEAKRRKIKLIGMVRSWDNCYSKGFLRVKPDFAIVNNQNIKEELNQIHLVDNDKIEIVGIPQYDIFVKGKRSSKTDFYKKIGADPKKKLILFAPAGAILSDTDWEICYILNKAIEDEKIKTPVQILIRNHPHHPADLSRVTLGKNMILDNPGKVFGLNRKETELTSSDINHLGDSLYHSSLVIFIATTLGNDSLVFDKPQIAIDFDGFKDKPYTQSVKRYHNEDHMRKMLNMGGVNTVLNEKELIDVINEALENPNARSGERKKTLVSQVYLADGNSGKRLGNALTNYIDKN